MTAEKQRGVIPMKVYGLVGKSGTGKSYQSMNVCRDRHIEAIVDDGLFICRNTIQAGHSAKRDQNKVSAIKTAIFQDPETRRQVAGKIKEVKPKSILVLGTSEEMIERICSRLELPKVSEMIHIEDVASQDAITTALRQRQEQGKHVIPVPTFEIKPQFSGYFMAPLRILRGKNDRQGAMQERSVVRPTYSYLGEFTISDKTVLQLIHYTCGLSESVAEVLKCGDQEPAGRCGDQYRRRIFLRFFTAAEGAGAAESGSGGGGEDDRV